MSHPPTAGAHVADLHERIRQFYAVQMRLLDSGAAEEWAATFTPDGVFEQNVDPEPLRGRPAIAVAARRRVDNLRADGLTRRHWLGMVHVDPVPDGSVRARYYAIAYAVASASGDHRSSPEIYASTVADDVLVHDHDGWLVAHRRVVHDGRS
ncbi:nuclear transport factor 2 family protein [Micromonospora sp. KC721]|uniref:nuclear transport factor 2 family protein n=1 Tax=Micromonospora sp. KC721 TaxID=2530380 RepID=UPI001FB5C57B|nr:nuclear transport factor 2 family protein [Micromonospora sp. KC721]